MSPGPDSRRTLPVAPPPVPSPSSQDIRQQNPPYRRVPAIAPPESAPNVVVVLLDDMGFGAPSTFGGPCQMPTADALAEDGIRYTRFHTTGICSPTRASLLTGRNPHAVGMGYVADMATPPPGYNAMMPTSAASIARVLTLNGYSTGAFGKMHEMPRHEVSPTGPFDRWPTHGGGFEKFYGFLGGGINHWYPSLFDGTTAIEQPSLPEDGYHLSEDITDRAIDWISDVATLTPDKPFFCYLPFGATHAPFHVLPEWRDRYRGEFDNGWDRQREITLERQKELGIVPESADLAPWVDEVPRWDQLGENEQRAAAGLMELYAGFAEHTDAQVGRLVDALRERDLLDNTIFIYILGDNGASPEGTLAGTMNQYRGFNGIAVTAEEILAEEKELGGPGTWPHYPVGWALAMDTPYQWMKQVASHYGGTRNGMVVHWPNGIAQRGLRPQWHHVNDLYPTILEAIGLPCPTVVDGVPQQRIDGVSMAYTFNEPDAPDQKLTQYFEVGGSRAIYHEGWVACTVHRRTPWNINASESPDFVDDVWELYDTSDDWSQAHDVAAEHPERLARLKELFWVEAARNNVLPLDDRSMPVRRNSERRSVDAMTFHGKATRLPYDAIPNIVGSSFRISAALTVRDSVSAEGVVCAIGGDLSGYSFYFTGGRLTFCHNVGGNIVSCVRSESNIEPGEHTVAYEFDRTSDELGSGGIGTLLVDGDVVGRGPVQRTVSFMFLAGEFFNVGRDPVTPVSPEYVAFENGFNGSIRSVTMEILDRPAVGSWENTEMEFALQ